MVDAEKEYLISNAMLTLGRCQVEMHRRMS